MAVTPDTTIRLLKVPIEIDNMNQLTFTNATAQYNYFHNLPNYIEEEDLYYQRKDNFIEFPAHIDTILQYNYCMYQNSNYSSKWFYAFITKMEYENDGTTKIYIETDVYQTWQFDIIYKNSFIEREHVNDDTIGLHTIPENLNVGDAIQVGNEISDTAYDNTTEWIGISSNYVIKDNSDGFLQPDSANGVQYDGITVYNNTVFGSPINLFQITIGQTVSGFGDVLRFIKRTNHDGHINDIQQIFFISNACIEQSALTSHTATYKLNSLETGETFTWYTMPYSTSPKTFNTTLSKPTSFSDITLKNNKCLVYPYNYLFVSNNNGSNNIFKYEDFSGTNCVFENQLSLSIGNSGRIVPKDYRGKAYDDDEAIALGKLPVCEWSGDAFTNWLTQNGVNIAVSLGLTAAQIGAGGLALNIATKTTKGITDVMKFNQASNLGLSGASQIGTTIGDFYQASLLPNIMGGQPVGDVLFAASRNKFIFRQMRAKKEYLEVIDNYFSCYGYKVNANKVPNITGRTNWNYVKTINANIEGDIPQEDLQKIKDILNNGVTFWHNPLTFLDYSQSNAII